MKHDENENINDLAFDTSSLGDNKDPKAHNSYTKQILDECVLENLNTWKSAN
jgi:hypothetical protein